MFIPTSTIYRDLNFQISVFIILICIFGLITLLKKRNPDSETYSTAVQDRYFTVRYASTSS